MTVAFLTQYYRGLGHSQRIKFIAEKLGETEKVVIMDQLFQPPLSYSVSHVAFLKDYKLNDVNNMFQFIMQEELINFRIKMFIKTLQQYDVKTLVCEGFPFCRHQFAHEYIRYFEECKKRDIKIIISVRDFPWDEPHDNALQDWVAYTQNLVIKYYAEKILIHGDPKILPLYADRFRHANSRQIIEDIKDKIIYTGYVCDNSIRKHKKKNNNIYVSTGLNKEEGMLLFKNILKIAPNFPDYTFVMTVANRYLTTGSKKKANVYMVEYIPNLRTKLVDCAAYITYGGYNATVEILQSGIPSIIVPRQDGQKMEQFARAYTFEPYNYFKVAAGNDIKNLETTLEKVLSEKPKPFEFNMNGTEESANAIKQIHDGRRS